MTYKTAKLGDICKIIKGTTGIASAVPGEYPLVVTAQERKTCSTYQFDCEAVCIPLVSSSGHGKKSLKNVHYQSGKFALGSILCAVIPNNPDELDARYLHQYLQFYKDTLLVPLMKGAANVSLSMRDIAKVEIPLVPIEKQKSLADMFVSLNEKQATLFAEYDKQSEYAKLLRQNILQEAIEGRLTADWRKQNPIVKGNPDFDAEALFEKIQEERCHADSILLTQNQGKSMTSSKNQSISLSGCQHMSLSGLTRQSIIESETPFEIPSGWKWVRLNQIAKIGTGATPLTSEKKYYENGSIPWVTSSSTSNDVITKGDSFITKLALEETNCSLNPIGTLIVAMYGQGKTRGQISELKIEAATNQACATINLFEKNDNLRKYIKNVFKKMYEEIRSLAQGGAQPNLNLSKIARTTFPLPPLAEQTEIVRKVELLLAKVSEIENQIEERQEQTKQLVQVILKDAFEKE